MSASRNDKIQAWKITETLMLLNSVRERFSRLPKRLREALGLVLIDGKTYQQAADELKISVEELSARLAEARETLRRSLDAEAAEAKGKRKAGRRRT